MIYGDILCVSQLELRSQAAIHNPALSAVGVTPLRQPCAQGLVMSHSYKEALDSLLSAWAGMLIVFLFKACMKSLMSGNGNDYNQNL